MKKNLIIFTLLSLTIFLPMAAIAYTPPTEPSTTISFNTLLNKIGTVFWQIFGLMAIIMFLIGGIEFLVSQGDPEKIQKARSFFMWGVVGVAAALLGYSLIYIINSALL
jgi:hypothetical protein